MFEPTMENSTIDGSRWTQEKWDALDWSERKWCGGFAREFWHVPDPAQETAHRVRAISSEAQKFYQSLDLLIASGVLDGLDFGFMANALEEKAAELWGGP